MFRDVTGKQIEILKRDTNNGNSDNERHAIENLGTQRAEDREFLVFHLVIRMVVVSLRIGFFSKNYSLGSLVNYFRE